MQGAQPLEKKDHVAVAASPQGGVDWWNPMTILDEKSFSELHCISDLHLGGPPGRQIFDQGSRLAKLIDYLRTRDTPRLGLVINGDVVDFLAEEPAAYLDPAQAIDKLERIVARDPAFVEVWRPLRVFVSTPSRRLIL